MIYTKTPITLTALRKLGKPPPKQFGKYWRPMPHHQLLASLKRLAAERGWELTNPNIHLNASATDMAATFDIGGKGFAALHSIVGQTCLGIYNSNAQSRALTLYGGVKDIPLARIHVGRHSEGVDLEHRLNDALKLFYFSHAAQFPNVILRAKQTKLGGDGGLPTAYELLSDAGRRRLMPWSRIGRIASGYQTTNGKTVWDLLVLFAKVARMNPPLKQMRQVYGFFQLLKGESEE